METIQLVTSKPKTHKNLRPERAVFYKRGQVVEAISDDQELYYLFFYKQQFLTAVKTKRLKIHGYLADAFRYGEVYTQNHPFINALIVQNKPLKKISYPQLKKKLERSYSQQEQAHILTQFESFVPKKQLFKDIQALFYMNRREGKMFTAYTIVRVMMNFAPKTSFVKQVGNDLSFNKYAMMYIDKSRKLLDQDPLFAEECACFKEHCHRLEKENRWIEAVSLKLTQLKTEPSQDMYEAFLNVANDHFDNHGVTTLIEDLAGALPSLNRLTQDLIHQYLQNQNVRKLSIIVKENKPELNQGQLEMLAAMLENVDFKENLEALSPLIGLIVEHHPENSGPLLEKYVSVLMETKELEEIYRHLSQYRNSKTLPILQKIEQMNRIRDDLDHMQQLGEWYYEFHQLDKALECFQLEMELNPSDPKPLRWLAQVYQDKQMVHESKVYKQLCVDVQKWA